MELHDAYEMRHTPDLNDSRIGDSLDPRSNFCFMPLIDISESASADRSSALGINSTRGEPGISDCHLHDFLLEPLDVMRS
jgi:hypothetical protein